MSIEHDDASPNRLKPSGGDKPVTPLEDRPGARSGVRFKGSAKVGHVVEMNGPDALKAIFGTDDPDQANGFLSHCLKALHGSEAGDAGESGDERPFMLAIVRDLAPRDAVERMLAVQMAATHVATIRAGRGLAMSTMLPQLQAHGTNFNKLARTFAAQMEALRKHRNGGQQKVRVEHVHVHPGGQAIVGDVHHGGEGGPE